ncbi:hypothetical protein A9Q77_08255, partial [Marinomonas sp. 42_23_T18]
SLSLTIQNSYLAYAAPHFAGNPCGNLCIYYSGGVLLRPETYQIISHETTYLMAFLVSECNKATELSLLIMLREYR